MNLRGTTWAYCPLQVTISTCAVLGHHFQPHNNNNNNDNGNDNDNNNHHHHHHHHLG